MLPSRSQPASGPTPPLAIAQRQAMETGKVGETEFEDFARLDAVRTVTRRSRMW